MFKQFRLTRIHFIAVMASMAMLLAACSDPEPAAGPVDEEVVDEPGVEVDLAAVCPERIPVQMGWFAQPARGYLFEVAEPDGEVTEDGKYIAPFKVDPRVEIELRTGGPYIGFQSNEAVAYGDSDIMLYEASTAEQVNGIERFPSVSVFASLVKDPQILMFNPEVYDFESIEDIRDSGATVFVFEGVPYWEFLAHYGLLDQDQIDSGFTGAPDRFVAEGDIVQQGYITDEPFEYENLIEAWGRPVESLLIADHSDYDVYVNALAVRAAEFDGYRDCFQRLVPVFQQGLIDYMASPDESNLVISDMLVELAEFYQLSPEKAAYAIEMMTEHELVGNSPDGAVGSFDLDRVQQLIDLLIPVFEEQGVDIPEGLSAENLVTNEFIDPSIGF